MSKTLVACVTALAACASIGSLRRPGLKKGTSK